MAQATHILNALSFLYLSLFSEYDAAPFGKYYIELKSIELCTPSIPIDKDYNNNATFFIEKEDNRDKLVGAVNIEKDIVLTSGVLIIEIERSSVNNGARTTIISEKPKSICKDLFMGSMLRSMYTVDEKCTIKAGNYKIDMPIDKFVHTIVPEYNYGNVTVTFETHTKNGAVYCSKTIASVLPLKD